ncbi:MAG: hypothetical protein CFE29_22720 [Bradyrhizobiaceae bacterium PARB1]|nr:MAG: hypothetical protein CFE29_22720 [Bradyrhizobiaceae bacterium PARB1]
MQAWQATTFHTADANFTERNGRISVVEVFACLEAVCQSGSRALTKAESRISGIGGLMCNVDATIITTGALVLAALARPRFEQFPLET